MFNLPSPYVCNVFLPLLNSLKDISGLDKAILKIISFIKLPSLEVDFKNFLLAGTLKNKSLTSITEPLFIPISVNDNFSPASKIISLPKSHSEGLLLNSNLDTEAIDGKASPLNPKVFIEYISSTVLILDVACGKNAFSISKL